MIAPRFQRVRALPDRLQQSLLAAPQLAALPFADLEPWRMRRTERATVYHLRSRSDAAAPSYWLKVHTEGDGRARQEYDLLVEMTNVRTPGVTSIEPVGWLEEHDALITRHADGRHLSRVLHNGLSPWLLSGGNARRAASYCRRAGRWLGQVHGLGTAAGAPWAGDRVVRDVPTVLAVPSGRWCVPPEVFVQIDRVSGVLAALVPPEDLVPVRAHGDFGTHNILLNGDDLVVLDPSFTSLAQEVGLYRPRFFDLTRFWSTIQGNTRANLRSTRRAELLRSFLAGYNEVTGLAVSPARPAFRLFALRHMLLSLRDWPTLVGRILPATRTSTLRWWIQRLEEEARDA